MYLYFHMWSVSPERSQGKGLLLHWGVNLTEICKLNRNMEFFLSGLRFSKGKSRKYPLGSWLAHHPVINLSFMVLWRTINVWRRDRRTFDEEQENYEENLNQDENQEEISWETMMRYDKLWWRPRKLWRGKQLRNQVEKPEGKTRRRCLKEPWWETMLRYEDLWRTRKLWRWDTTKRKTVEEPVWKTRRCPEEPCW